ncbi:MAG TPA: methyltransferase domain-containing protein [Acidimicrobiia bacterium]|nr:methyltransferase domain-containing protein [Acidimicrobiia bacterium]
MSKDLMFKDEIQALVRDAYEKLDEPNGPGLRCYEKSQLAGIPTVAGHWSLGVGNPVRHARLAPGDAVVDLGCGGGLDVLLAARNVGPSGRVVGVDLLDSMLERGRRAASEAGLTQIDFLRSEMESVPLPDHSVDSVISNGSFNLSARKSRVMAEAFRLLKPGGRLCVSDLTISEDELPPEILTHPSAWAG